MSNTIQRCRTVELEGNLKNPTRDEVTINGCFAERKEWRREFVKTKPKIKVPLKKCRVPWG
jgi:hypothetical protein